MGAWAYQWLSKLWANSITSPQAMVDCNGNTISLSQTVKLVGTVASITPTDTHFGAIGVKLTHPNGNGPLVGQTIFVDPSQLVIGS